MAAEQVELAVSTMDLYPIGLPRQVSWGSYADRLDDYLDDTGFNSVELHPTENAFVDMTALNETPADAAYLRSVIGSMHQTFNDGTGAIGLAARLAGLYKMDESYDRMLEMSRGVDAMPLVVYPSEALEEANAQGLHTKSPLVVQPAPEVYRDYSVFSTEALLVRLGAMGVAGLCPDTVHARRQSADGFKGPAMEDVWTEQFQSGYVHQMHVALDRVDMAHRDKEMAALSHDEFNRFLMTWKAARHTQIGDMIVEAVQQWKPPQSLEEPTLRMVVEIPPLPRQILRRKKQHRIICDHLAQIVSDAGAVPIVRDFE